MLLRNESRVRHSIDIKLVFDDGKTREVEIHECDYVQVSYRKNCCVKCGVGIIRDIRPYIHNKRMPFCKRESAVITIDMSKDMVAYVEKIDMYDIIDIRIVCPCCNCPNKPEEEIPEEEPNAGCVGCPVTEKGVVGS